MTQILVTKFRPDDETRWRELWRGYLEFYETTLPIERYVDTWRRLMSPEAPIHGFGAREGSADAPLIGITHYLFHAHAWSDREVCYLQDLFVDSTVRGNGAGRALIERVAAAARERGCFRLYWTTKEDNHRARRLYDLIAKHNGFIRYDYPLD
jgi:GNAT superfamily N-acetyltransferase